MASGLAPHASPIPTTNLNPDLKVFFVIATNGIFLRSSLLQQSKGIFDGETKSPGRHPATVAS
jgi:hypothetical protein